VSSVSSGCREAPLRKTGPKIVFDMGSTIPTPARAPVAASSRQSWWASVVWPREASDRAFARMSGLRMIARGHRISTVCTRTRFMYRACMVSLGRSGLRHGCGRGSAESRTWWATVWVRSH
jgi:hypothetical protein